MLATVRSITWTVVNGLVITVLIVVGFLYGLILG